MLFGASIRDFGTSAKAQTSQCICAGSSEPFVDVPNSRILAHTRPNQLPHLQQHLPVKQLCNLSREEALVHTGEAFLGFCWVVYITVTPKLLSLMNFNELFQL